VKQEASRRNDLSFHFQYIIAFGLVMMLEQEITVLPRPEDNPL
jgi:hypothetical protein